MVSGFHAMFRLSSILRLYTNWLYFLLAFLECVFISVLLGLIWMNFAAKHAKEMQLPFFFFSLGKELANSLKSNTGQSIFHSLI